MAFILSAMVLIMVCRPTLSYTPGMEQHTVTYQVACNVSQEPEFVELQLSPLPLLQLRLASVVSCSAASAPPQCTECLLGWPKKTQS